MVKRLAPVQAQPKVTVRQKDGSSMWCHDGENAARRDVLVTILEQSRFRRKPNLSFPKPRNGYLLKRLLHTKLAMCSGQQRSCQMEKLVRALEAEALQVKTSLEECLQSNEKQWLDSVSRLHYRRVRKSLLQHGQRPAATGLVPQEDKDAEIASSCPNQEKDIGDAKNWRTIALLSHIGKAWAKASVRTLVPAVGKATGPCKFGSLPGRSTRDATAILRKRVREIHQIEPPRKPPQLSPSHRFLFDLEKAFDTIPRGRLWAAVSDAAEAERTVSGAEGRLRRHVLHHSEQPRNACHQSPRHDGSTTGKR